MTTRSLAGAPGVPADQAATAPVVVVGHLDVLTAGVMRKHLSVVLSASTRQPVVLDLGGVSSIDIAGLEPLLEARSWLTERGRRLSLRAVPDCVTQLLELTDHGETFDLDVAPSRLSLDGAVR